MTNITLSIKDEVYNRMKSHSEIKWSEYVRKIIEKRLDELEDQEESYQVSLLSQESLMKYWDNEIDDRWNDYV